MGRAVISEKGLKELVSIQKKGININIEKAKRRK
jgi:hypothetical protein